MKMTDCHSSVSFFIYCGAAVLVIVNGQGQSMADDEVDNDRIGKLIDAIAQLRDVLTKIKGG